MPTTIETLSLPNFLDPNILEELSLSADAAPSQAIINVANANNVAINDYLVLVPAAETGELRKINSLTGNAITLTANLSLQHRNHERVIKLFGNKIRVYRATNVDGTVPDDSAFTLLATVTIDPDQTFSYYTDSAGGSEFWYKCVYYNDITDGSTEIALSEAVRGGGYGHYVSLADLRAEAGLDHTKKLDETQVATRREEAESEVKGALAAAGYLMPLQTSNQVLFVPPLIRGVARLLGAGLILAQNFGTAKPSSAKDGKSKTDAARAILKQIQNNEIVLLDTNDTMLAKPSLVDGYPDDTTKDDGLHTGPIITMSKVF